MGTAASTAYLAPAPAPDVQEAPAPRQDEDWSWRRVELGRFDVLGVDVLGVGAHCVVRRGVEGDRVVAVKEYAEPGGAARLTREVAVLQRLAAASAAAWGGRVVRGAARKSGRGDAVRPS